MLVHPRKPLWSLGDVRKDYAKFDVAQNRLGLHWAGLSFQDVLLTELVCMYFLVCGKKKGEARVASITVTLRLARHRS